MMEWTDLSGFFSSKILGCIMGILPKPKGFVLSFSDDKQYYMITQDSKLVIPTYGTGIQIFFLAYNSFQEVLIPNTQFLP